jgi:hypothetical protein
MTIKEAAEATGIELENFYKKYKIPDNVFPETMMKEINKIVDGYNLDEIKQSIGSSNDDKENGK